jgi:hypothetical protein
MNIRSNTIFLFITTSSNNIEDRFLYDTEYCIKNILAKGVKLANIIVATDANFDLVCAKCPAISGVNFITSQQVTSTIEQLNSDNLIVVANCHGSIQGIDAQNAILPHAITEALKNNQSFQNILVLFGQCYAGIYNWVDIRHDHKNIVYMGATGFDTSLSCQLSNNISWCANISVIAFWDWMLNPKDIDGDGCLTVMDLYKYIAWFTNAVTDDIEKVQTSLLIDKKVEIRLAMLKEQGDTSTEMKRLEKAAVEALESYIVPHQTPWLLNAITAQQIQFEY